MKVIAILTLVIAAACTPAEKSDHPRLFFKTEDIQTLRFKAKSEAGSLIIDQLRERLSAQKDALYLGSFAAGHGLLYHLTGDQNEAEKAAEIVKMVIKDELSFMSDPDDPGSVTDIVLWNSTYKAIYRTPNIMGVAMAYDFCYDAWEEHFRQSVARELEDKVTDLLEGGGEGWNPNPWSNWHGITKVEVA
ncbi:MAG: hypothetical protein RLQ12_06275 [Cyclobacteriaceae bacterium]